MDLSATPALGCASLDAEALTVLAGTTAPLTRNRLAVLAARGRRTGLAKVLERLSCKDWS